MLLTDTDFHQMRADLETQMAAIINLLNQGYNIQHTKDYNKFRTLTANRAIKRPHVERLKLSFLEKYVINPIIVNEKFEIIDGQHRFLAASELGIEIVYIVVPGLTIADCARLNEKSQDWSESDFVHCYAVLGNENYIRLERCVQANSCPLRYPLYVCHRKAAKGDAKSSPIKSGALIFTEEDAATFNKKFPMIKELSVVLATPMSELFTLAATKVIDHPGYDHNKMLVQATNYGRDKFEKRVDVKGYMEEFSEVYNFRRKNDDSRIFFEDILRRKKTA